MRYDHGTRPDPERVKGHVLRSVAGAPNERGEGAQPLIHDEAARWLYRQDYRISDGKVWYVTVHDTEYWEGVALAQWDNDDWPALAELLVAHDYPQSFLSCFRCNEGEVTELGDLCPRCSSEDSMSEAGDRAYEISSNK